MATVWIELTEAAPANTNDVPNLSIFLNVPGYASQLQGKEEKSYYTSRKYYAFRSVFYGEKPTNLNRFLVWTYTIFILKQN